MTSEEAIALSKFQRPGRRVIVGAVEGADVPEGSIVDAPVWRLNKLGVTALDVLEELRR